MNPGNDKLHLGCGHTTPESWVNLDGSWNAWLSKHPMLRGLLRTLRLAPARLFEFEWSPDIVVHDVRNALPFSDNTFAALYSSHMLEHLYLDDAKRVLKECRRVLRPGGVVRVAVPDLRTAVADYVANRPGPNPRPEYEGMPAGDILNRRLLLRPTKPPAGSLPYRMYSLMKDFHTHKWMYDAESLAFHLSKAGFIDLTQKPFQDSRIDGIEEVETDPARVTGGGVCVEGVKPF